MLMHRLSVRELKQKMDTGQPMLIIDVREGFCDSDRMIPGAIPIDARDINPHLFNLGHDVDIVVYGSQEQDDATIKVADALQAAGYHADSLQGGWSAWLDSGFPTEARQSRPLPRTAADLEAAIQPRDTETEASEAQGPGWQGHERAEKSITAEARERVQETAEGATYALGDLAGRALRLVQTLIRR